MRTTHNRLLFTLLTAALSLGATAALALDTGVAAPSVQGTDLQTGKSVSLASMKGKVVLVDFWASWCAPCKAEMPVLEKLSKKYSGKLVVLGVSVDDDAKAAKEFLKSKVKVSFPIVHDAGHKVADNYEPPKMPSSYLIDDKGRVRFVQAGFTKKDEATLEAEIQKLLK